MFSGGNGFVCASVVCALFAAGYAFDFGGDPRLVVFKMSFLPKYTVPCQIL